MHVLLVYYGALKANEASHRMATGTLRKISGMMLQFKDELIEKAEDAIDKIEASLCVVLTRKLFESVLDVRLWMLVELVKTLMKHAQTSAC